MLPQHRDPSDVVDWENLVCPADTANGSTPSDRLTRWYRVNADRYRPPPPSRLAMVASTRLISSWLAVVRRMKAASSRRASVRATMGLQARQQQQGAAEQRLLEAGQRVSHSAAWAVFSNPAVASRKGRGRCHHDRREGRQGQAAGRGQLGAGGRPGRRRPPLPSRSAGGHHQDGAVGRALSSASMRATSSRQRCSAGTSGGTPRPRSPAAGGACPAAGRRRPAAR